MVFWEKRRTAPACRASGGALLVVFGDGVGSLPFLVVKRGEMG